MASLLAMLLGFFWPSRKKALSLMQRHPCYHYTRLPVKCSTMEVYDTHNKRPATHPAAHFAAHLVKPSGSCWSANSILESLKVEICGKRRLRKEKRKKVGGGRGGSTKINGAPGIEPSPGCSANRENAEKVNKHVITNATLQQTPVDTISSTRLARIIYMLV